MRCDFISLKKKKEDWEECEYIHPRYLVISNSEAKIFTNKKKNKKKRAFIVQRPISSCNRNKYYFTSNNNIR